MSASSNSRSSSRWKALRPLLNRDYRLMIAVVGLSLFATGMWTIVMVFQVLAIKDDPAALSAVAACLSAGLLLAAVPGGIVADRRSRRRIVIAVQISNTIAIITVAVLGLSHRIELWHLALAAFALGAGSAFFYPAYSALLPTVLAPEELLAANGLEGALRPTMQQALGPALGGAIVGATIPAAGASVAAGIFGFALVLALLIGKSHEPTPDAADAGGTSALSDLKDGLRFVVGTRWLLWTLLFASLMALVVMGPIEVLLPFIVRENFADSERLFGLLLAVFGLGGAAGSLTMSSLELPRRYLTVMVMGWGAGTLPLALVGFTSSFMVMCGALFAVGFSTGVGMVIWGTLLQRRVPLDMLGRVASLDFFVSIAFMPLSIVLAGLLATVVPISALFLAAGLTPVLLAAIAVWLGRMPQDEAAHPLKD